MTAARRTQTLDRARDAIHSLSVLAYTLKAVSSLRPFGRSGGSGLRLMHDRLDVREHQ